MSYAELQITTNFSFLRGASWPHEYFNRAMDLGIRALGITDRNSLAGVVKGFEAAQGTGIRLVVGCRLTMSDSLDVLVYPTNKAAYSRLCRLLSLGKSRGGKGKCKLSWNDLCEWSEGLLAVMVPEEADERLVAGLKKLKTQFGNRAYMALTLRRRPRDHYRLWQLNQIAQAAQVKTVVTNDVLFHNPSRRILQDVVTCIREKCTIDASGFKKEQFADRFLKPPDEMARLFKDYPEALSRTLEIVDRCKFSLDELKYQYPDEASIAGLNSQQALEQYTWEGASWRYPEGVPDKVTEQIRHELRLINELNYAPYFLTVFNIVRFSRSKGILCQGRGSAANSAVCFVLGITSIDPMTNNLLFERFISSARNEPPDIDVDFEHERREEIIQWIYETYGRTRAALTSTIRTYRPKSAIREVGKALGLSEDITAAISNLIWAWGKDKAGNNLITGLNLNTKDYRLRLTLDLARELAGFPRHMSQHPGGFVLTNDRLDDLVPIEPARMKDRQVIEWDKNDIDTLKFMKVDVLGLGMLGAMRRCFDLLKQHKNLPLDIATIPADDTATYDMICKADTIGVFQIESRAQMSMLPRIKPRCLYDLTIEIAIVRPGPIQGDMVHPYLRRREGKEKPDLPSPELRDVLGKTLGVPLFQEQAMSIAIKCAGFTPSEADELRRAMATFKLTGGVSRFHEKFVKGMLANGYPEEFALRCFKQVEGFGSYGFPESHAASFALLAYGSSWLKCHHPDAFLCAMLNAWPMGFYHPAQLVRDARQHGVEVLQVDVNFSHWDCMLERTQSGFAVRLGMRMVKGLANDDAARIVAARSLGKFDDIEEMQIRAQINTTSIEMLAKANAFKSLSIVRRKAYWISRTLRNSRLPLFERDGQDQTALFEEPSVSLTAMTEGHEVITDYQSIGLTLNKHPVSFLRDRLATRNVIPTSALQDAPDGSMVIVSGLVLVRQKPGSAKGVMFMTIEDETSHANLIIWPSLFEQNRRLLLSSRMIACYGKLQREGLVIHVIANAFRDWTDMLRHVPGLNMPLPTVETDAMVDINFGLRNFC